MQVTQLNSWVSSKKKDMKVGGSTRKKWSKSTKKAVNGEWIWYDYIIFMYGIVKGNKNWKCKGLTINEN